VQFARRASLNCLEMVWRPSRKRAYHPGRPRPNVVGSRGPYGGLLPLVRMQALAYQCGNTRDRVPGASHNWAQARRPTF